MLILRLLGDFRCVVHPRGQEADLDLNMVERKDSSSDAKLCLRILSRSECNVALIFAREKL